MSVNNAETFVYDSEVYTVKRSDLGVDTSMYFSKYVAPLINGLDELKVKHPIFASFNSPCPTDLQIKYHKSFFKQDQFLARLEVDEKKSSVVVSLVNNKTQELHNEMVAIFRNPRAEECRQFVLPGCQYVQRDYTVVFATLDVSGQASLIKILDCLGEARELYGIRVLPHFIEGIFQGKFLLKSHSLNLSIHAPLVFGDEFTLYISCLKADYASFIIQFQFVDLKTNLVKISGTQKIAYCSVDGKPQALPGDWRNAMLS